MKAYVAWLELTKEPVGSMLGSPNPRLEMGLGENRMIISEFFADSDDEARLRARHTVANWEPDGDWTGRSVVKIWEVVEEIPTDEDIDLIRKGA